MKTFTYLIAFFFVALYNPLIGQTDSVFITPITTVVGNQVRVDFPVERFEGVACLQYTMNYDYSVLQFDNIGNLNLPDLGTGNFNAVTNPGKITFSWIDMTTQGITKPDGESIYSIFFSNAGGGGVSDLFIDGSMTPVEACIPFDVIPLIFETITIAAFSTTSSKDIDKQTEVDVYPNPAFDQVTIDVDGIKDALQIEIYNTTGKLINSYQFQNEQLILPKSDLGSGLFYYRLYSNDEVINTGKFTFL